MGGESGRGRTLEPLSTLGPLAHVPTSGQRLCQTAARELTPAADWYSFGMVLYQALTGSAPFEGGLFEVLAQKQSWDPWSLREFAPHAPDDLSASGASLRAQDPQLKQPNRWRPRWAEKLWRSPLAAAP